LRFPVTIAVLVTVTLATLPGSAWAEGQAQCADLDDILASLDDEAFAQARRQILWGQVDGCSFGADDCLAGDGGLPCGVEDGEMGCSDFALAGYGSESFAGRLLDDTERPLNPGLNPRSACFVFSSRCKGLPPLETDQLTASRQIFPNLPHVSPTRFRGGVWWPDTDPFGAGLGPARGINADIDHPPQA
jgi:hypothetical protein